MAEVKEKKIEEEGSEVYGYDNIYKNGGNPEQLSLAPPMEGMLHKTIVVHEQEEDLEVSNNLEGNYEEEGLEVSNKLEGHYEVPPLEKESPAKVKTTKSFLFDKKEQRIRVINLVLRSIGVLFSFISFVIMASDDHGLDDYNSYDDESFNNFEAYRFCLAMAVIAFVYLVLQLVKGIYVMFFNPNLFRHVAFFYVDFIGDQLLAYLLMSSSSSAGSITRSLKRLGFSGRMVDLPAASLSMSFVAFASVAASSVLSAFALAKRIFW